jgi:hypothetical protein
MPWLSGPADDEEGSANRLSLVRPPPYGRAARGIPLLNTALRAGLDFGRTGCNYNSRREVEMADGARE